VTDKDAFTPLAAVLGDFQMDLGHQWAGCVEYLEATPVSFHLHRLGHTMGTEDNNEAVRYLVQFIDKNRAPLAQVFHHELVVHHFVTHVDRRTENFQGAVDDLDGSIDSGAEASGVSELDLHDGYLDARGTLDG